VRRELAGRYDVLWNHPLFSFLTLDITPLAAHPSRVV
jgi:muconolactone delta-isomerase